MNPPGVDGPVRQETHACSTDLRIYSTHEPATYLSLRDNTFHNSTTGRWVWQTLICAAHSGSVAFVLLMIFSEILMKNKLPRSRDRELHSLQITHAAQVIYQLLSVPVSVLHLRQSKGIKICFFRQIMIQKDTVISLIRWRSHIHEPLEWNSETHVPELFLGEYIKKISKVFFISCWYILRQHHRIVAWVAKCKSLPQHWHISSRATWRYLVQTVENIHASFF